MDGGGSVVPITLILNIHTTHFLIDFHKTHSLHYWCPPPIRINSRISNLRSGSLSEISVMRRRNTTNDDLSIVIQIKYTTHRKC